MHLRAFSHLTEKWDLLVTMTKNYTQISFVQRYQIQFFLKSGMKQKNAQEIGVHSSTISRELNRNIAKRGRTTG
jgi:transposase, IS30 family